MIVPHMQHRDSDSQLLRGMEALKMRGGEKQCGHYKKMKNQFVDYA